MGFAGTKGEGLDGDRVYPGRGAEEVASVASNDGEDTYTPGLMVHKEYTGRGVGIIILCVVKGNKLLT